MPYIACPACAKTVDIANVKFTVNERIYLDDEFYTSLRENIRCPHCKEDITLEVDAQILTHILVGKKTSGTPSLQRIEWGGGHEPALEYYEEEDE